MKNIDKIRAMSAEELANKMAHHCSCCINKDRSPCGSMCVKGILLWLNQEDNPMPDLEAGDVVKTTYGEYVAIGGAVLVNPITFARNFLGNLVDTVRFIYRYDGAEKEYETIWRADDESIPKKTDSEDI